MLNEETIRRYRDALRKTYEAPCSCAAGKHVYECKMGQRMMHDSLCTLGWILEDNPVDIAILMTRRVERTLTAALGAGYKFIRAAAQRVRGPRGRFVAGPDEWVNRMWPRMRFTFPAEDEGTVDTDATEDMVDFAERYRQALHD